MNTMPEIAPRITSDPGIRLGKPVITGTRVPVHTLIAKVAGGMSVEETAEEYGVTPQDVRAALGYAAEVVSLETVIMAT
jgi:uncharacterized protein (DUF433 family)